MKLSELCSFIETAVPPAFQESYDNSGLQVGMPDNDVNSAILTIDVTEKVVDEAIAHGHDLIISHHPLLFTGIKRISAKTSTERIIYKCIQNNIAVYSAHTSLDSVSNGVSHKMAEKLALRNVRILSPLEKRLLKLVTFIPDSHLVKVRSALFDAGAGVIGNYDQCGYMVSGTGSFRGNDETSPYTGSKGEFHLENEIRFETILYSHLKEKVINALISSHPYEEVAYDIYPLENRNINAGLGCVGSLPEPLDEKDLLSLLADTFGSKGIRYSDLTGKRLSRIAVCGGAGISLLGEAIASGAGAYVTGDIKYHNFFDAAGKILLVDIGHYESEKFSTEILRDLIIKKFPKFALRFSDTNTNPINYF